MHQHNPKGAKFTSAHDFSVRCAQGTVPSFSKSEEWWVLNHFPQYLKGLSYEMDFENVE